MDKIYAMKLFVRVAERESFSRAAEDIGLPKGSVSRQIQALEHQLGIRLLHRTTRRVQLTQDGMVYYERAKDLLSNLDELEGLFQPDPASISGKIRVDIPPCLANSLIMPRLPTFLHQYPGIALELCSSDRQVDLLREDFDCVVRNEILWMLMMAVIGFGVMVPVAGLLADAFGRRKSMVIITTLIILFALFAFTPLLGSGNPALVFVFLLLGLSLMGLTFGPMGALLPELFPTEVRYTGASFSYNVSSILGASVAPYIAAWLQSHYGLAAVGVYLASMAALTLIALLLTHETRHQAL
ncbi:MFS transporter [Salmonella enterica]|nr:MFS transporter [Salmonella enterica]